MTAHDYLMLVLQRQALDATQIDTVRGARAGIESDLRATAGAGARFYYGGSYAKQTMIRERFDLDVVIYYPPGDTRTLADIFRGTGNALERSGYRITPKTVAWHLPYEGGFHVDVVPGRAQDATYLYATLYTNTTRGGTLQTSLKKHIDAVAKTGLASIIRILKIWRLRHHVPLTTFAMEILAARALYGLRCDDYASATNTVFRFMYNEIVGVRLVDPANSNNVVEISSMDRGGVQDAAGAALTAPYWEHIVW